MKHIHPLILTLVMVLIPSFSFAQRDIAALEAYIHDHKEIRSLLLARSTLEASNALLHDYSRDAGLDFKEVNVNLDKYTRAFDVIDILYQSTRTALNVYGTVNTVSDRISDYKKILTDYHDKCLRRGDIEPSDTLIISVNYHMIEKVSEEVRTLYRSVSDLIAYATGAAACTTSDLMLVLTSINQSLDNIGHHLNCAYFDTWRYIQVRTGYWKAKVYNTKTRQEIIDDAFGRWRRSSYKAIGINEKKKYFTDDEPLDKSFREGSIRDIQP